MGLDMIDRDQRELFGIGQRFGKVDTDEQSADQSGGVGNRNGIDIGKGHSRFP